MGAANAKPLEGPENKAFLNFLKQYKKNHSVESDEDIYRSGENAWGKLTPDQKKLFAVGKTKRDVPKQKNPFYRSQEKDSPDEEEIRLRYAKTFGIDYQEEDSDEAQDGGEDEDSEVEKEVPGYDKAEVQVASSLGSVARNEPSLYELYPRVSQEKR